MKFTLSISGTSSWPASSSIRPLKVSQLRSLSKKYNQPCYYATVPVFRKMEAIM
ncbi:hypothetical protein HK413_10510 [Mucilaginibacter sp. S1162]|uniref:Uncharacterized protein n=1 Tax=Mucilaginibacter humi TaxID=2732510 RepID=A0ABX1W2J4_9SPHI|nr:hypothetical protein [Mucilaginibacter humi]NNU34451.1 hypothetical protein [Mucilaginibacter humi]